MDLDIAKLSLEELSELIIGVEQGLPQRIKVESAPTSLLDFAKALIPDYKTPKHIKLIASKLEAVEAGKIRRLMIAIPPRHGKTQLASKTFVPWYLGRNPLKSVITASYGQELSDDMGRAVKNAIQSPVFKTIFPHAAMSRDSASIRRFDIINTSVRTTKKGQYFAVGVGSAITGRGADLVIVDDPTKGQEEVDSALQRHNLHEWFRTTLYTRLMPDAALILIQCLTGDTLIMLDDGTKRPLRDIRSGDRIATYENGEIATSTVLNWTNHGPDRVFAIRMKSGTIVKANARHPFLVEHNGKTEWRRTASIQQGDNILRVTGESGAELSALNAVSQLKSKGFVRPIITKNVGLTAFARLRSMLGRVVRHICDIAMESISQSTKLFLKNSMGFVLSANSPPERMSAPIGAPSYALTTATTAAGSVDCSATTVTLLSDTEKPKLSSALPLTTFAIASDTVVEVVESGCEDVFDIQIDRTENFIANGLISHNTRWHEMDLAGYLLANKVEHWDVVSLPALAEEGDLLGREVGEALWPEHFDVSELLRTRQLEGPRHWNSLYQQRPSSERGNIIRREWWRLWGEKEPPKMEYIIQAYDTANAQGKDNDFTAVSTWGVFRIDGIPNVMLISVYNKKRDYQEMRKDVTHLYNHYLPDQAICEYKQSGITLVQDLQRAGIPLLKYTPDSDKVARVHAVVPFFESGRVWFPGKWWAEAMVDQCASFPFGKHDDMVDTMTLALLRLKQGFLLHAKGDPYSDNQDIDDDDSPHEERRQGYW